MENKNCCCKCDCQKRRDEVIERLDDQKRFIAYVKEKYDVEGKYKIKGNLPYSLAAAIFEKEQEEERGREKNERKKKFIAEIEAESKLGKFWCWHKWKFIKDIFGVGSKYQCQKCQKIKWS